MEVRDDLPLSTDDRRIGDASAVMAMEVANTEQPPRELLRSGLQWMTDKVDSFSTAFANLGWKGGRNRRWHRCGSCRRRPDTTVGGGYRTSSQPAFVTLLRWGPWAPAIGTTAVNRWLR